MAPDLPVAPAVAPAIAEPQWLDEREQHAWRQFVMGARRLFERLDHDLKVLGLTHDDYGVLVALSEAPGDQLRMAELAMRSVESRSRLSHHIGRLETRGLVQRRACPEDGRGLLAVLTPQGRDLVEAVAPHHVEGVRRWLLDHVTPEELDVIGEAFGKVDAAITGRCLEAMAAAGECDGLDEEFPG